MSFSEMIKRWLLAMGFALTSAILPASAQNINTPALITLTAQGAATVLGPDMANPAYRGAVVGINLTTMTTATVTVHIQGKDAISGTYYDILVSTGLASTGFTSLIVYPGVTIAANLAVSQPLPGFWRVEAVVVGASAAATGTIDATLIQ
jgi:hypothetical protein